MARATKKIKNIDLEENYIINKLEKAEPKALGSDTEEDRKTLDMLNSIRLESKRYRKIDDNTFILAENPKEKLTRHELNFEFLKKYYNKNLQDQELKTFFILAEILISLIQKISVEVTQK